MPKDRKVKVDKSFYEWRVKEIVKLAEMSPKYKSMPVDDIIEDIDNMPNAYFSGGNIGKKEKELFKEIWISKNDSISRKNFYEKEEGDEVSWEDLVTDMKRDLGEFTDIRTSDFRYLQNWLKSKILNKKITE